MLRIAVVGNTYPEVKRFAEYKFKDQIASVKHSEGIYSLKNGDMVYLCHSEQERDRYKSMLFDAFVVTEYYESLLDVIRGRTTRPAMG